MSYSLTKKIKPRLVDPGLMSALWRQKQPDPIGVVAPRPSHVQVLVDRVQSGIVEFLTEYFWVLVILSGIGLMLWHRYRWYQRVHKKRKRLGEDQTRRKQRNEQVPEAVFVPEPPRFDVYPADMYDAKNYSSF
jgi:hypothetical protein